jgi:hypothetical protein
LRQGEVVPASPPEEVVRDILVLGEWPFPALDALSAIPLFSADDTLDVREGYHPATRSYCHLGGLVVPAVRDQPTDQDVRAAREFLTEDLLGDFPFREPASLAAALSALLTPFVRALITGPTPLHLFDAPVAGSGKTLLAQVIYLIVSGSRAKVGTEGEVKAEWRKRITAYLQEAPVLVLFDNISGRLDSSALAAALTTETWTDRVLGSSRMASLPVACTWLATGNNVQLSEELARRTLWVRLDPGCDQAHLRTGFRHQNLLSWAEVNRPRLIWAALTLCQAWRAHGRPPGMQTLGGYESWAGVLGGVLGVAGVTGLLENADQFAAQANSERAEWLAFVGRWWARFGSSPVLVTELLQLAQQGELLEGVLGGKSPHAQKVLLGNALGQRLDRTFGDLRISRVEDDPKGRKRFRLVKGTR